MNYFIFTMALFFSVNAQSEQSIYSQKIKSIDRKEIDFSQFKDKPILVVNIATKCGYTNQLEGLEKIHKKYKEKGLVVIGVPSNEFGGQTPEKNKEVKDFCALKYGVSFLLTEKTKVKGAQKHKLFEILTSKIEVAWNFEKFLVDKKGKVVGRYSSDTEPDSKKIEDALKKIL